MSLHIVLGFNGSYRGTVPDVLYVGLDGEAANKVRLAAPHPRFLVLRDPMGHRRDNPKPGKVDVDALRALRGDEAREAAEQYEADLAAAYKRGGEAAAARIAELEAQLAGMPVAASTSEPLALDTQAEPAKGPRKR